MLADTPTPEEQAEYFRLQSEWSRAWGWLQSLDPASPPVALEEWGPDGVDLDPDWEQFAPLEVDPEELAQAERAVMAAEYRWGLFELEHAGKAFRIFSDEMIENARDDTIEPLPELEGLGW